MIESLINQDAKSKIYILALDENVYFSIKKLFKSKVEVIKLKDFENNQLLKVKSNRSIGEYCWTITPWLIKYCLEKYNLSDITYIDSDLFFFDNPGKVFPEDKKYSIFITPHNYTKDYDQSQSSGIYCVQFLKIVNDFEGVKCLNKWADQCLDWCYNRVEDGKFGDQKYLDEWPNEYNRVFVLKSLTIGLAPWNIQQFQLEEKKDKIYSRHTSGEESILTYYHFHEVKLSQNILFLNFYYLLEYDVLYIIHSKYFNSLEKMEKIMKNNKIKPIEIFKPLLSILLEELYNKQNELRAFHSKYSLNSRLRAFIREKLFFGFLKIK